MRFIIAFVLFLSSACWAQTAPLADTFQNAEQVDGSSTKTFVGKPAVIIEKENAIEPEINRAELLPPPTLIRPDLIITTPFGHQRTAAFVDHTTDFALMVQLLDDHTAHVEEVIQVMTTQDIPTFRRVYPHKDITILSVRENSSDIPYTLTDGVLETPHPLSSGLHRITVSYMVNYAHTKDTALSDIIIPLVGVNWPFMTERFSIVLMLPKKGNIYTNELLFGTNDQKISENVLITKDTSGTILYQLTRPLPAYAEVKLHLTTDSALFPKVSKGLTTFQILMMIYLTILCGYTVLSILTARYKKHTQALKIARKINPILWYLAVGYNLSALHISSDKHRVASQPPLKIISFIRFNYEYIIGLIMLGILTLALFRYANTPVSAGWIWGTAVISLAFIHIFGTKRELLNLLTTLRHILMETPQGLNLPSREIPTYYTIACLFGFGTLWEKQLKKQNPNYTTRLKQEKEALSSASIKRTDTNT